MNQIKALKLLIFFYFYFYNKNFQKIELADNWACLIVSSKCVRVDERKIQVGTIFSVIFLITEYERLLIFVSEENFCLFFVKYIFYHQVKTLSMNIPNHKFIKSIVQIIFTWNNFIQKNNKKNLIKLFHFHSTYYYFFNLESLKCCWELYDANLYASISFLMSKT